MIESTKSVSALRRVALCALLAVMPGATLAAGSEDGSSASASVATYDQAKAAAYAGKFAEAEGMLLGITKAEPANADAWNMLGYSSRKLGKMKAASRAYDKALKLNPRHLGALEYQGEMFLQTGKPDKARANLETLKSLCGTCEEMRDLQKALKAAGAA